MVRINPSRSTGTGCPERLWSLLLWRYSKPTWTRSYAACSGWPCFSRGVGPDDPQRSLPTPNILWFCDHRQLYSNMGLHIDVHIYTCICVCIWLYQMSISQGRASKW